MDTTLGWMFIALAALFSLALLPRLAGRFYPTRPGYVTRLAAPVIFGLIAAACFAGYGLPALAVIAVVGFAQIIANRKRVRPAVIPLPIPDNTSP